MALKPEGEEVCPEAVNLTPDTLEEALRTIRVLHERQASNNKRGTAQQLLVWRRRALAYEEALGKLDRARQEQLQVLSGQLLLFKARLARKQKDISRMLGQREAVIQRQQRTIHLLQARLQEAGLDNPHPDLDSPTGETNLDSLNDSDSAVIMEDGLGSDHEHSGIPRFRYCGEHCGGGGGVTVVRSISDAVEPPSAKWRQQQFSSQPQRGSCFLRRPEVLETVYSVEEDGEGDGTSANTTTTTTTATTTSTAAEDPDAETADGDSPDNQQDCQSLRRTSHSYKADSNSSIEDTPSVDDSSCSTTTGRPWAPGSLQYGSLEILTDPGDIGVPQEPPVATNGAPNHVTTYNRVMSNHRSVTKPKDVKYKRINKAKSKSLEELRGRLRNWVDKGISSNKFISLDQSYA